VDVRAGAGDWTAMGNGGERESERTAGSDQQVEEEQTDLRAQRRLLCLGYG